MANFSGRVRELYAVEELQDGCIYRDRVIAEILWPTYAPGLDLSWQDEYTLAQALGGYVIASPSTHREYLPMTRDQVEAFVHLAHRLLGRE